MKLRASNGISRRSFLKATALAGGGMIIGSMLPIARTSAAAGTAEMGPFIRISPDNKITVVIKHLDKGQGVTTGLPTIVAEELDAAWSQMATEFAPVDASRYANLLFGVQGTGGSTSIANSWDQLRNAAAAARQMLLQAAANDWSVDVADLRISEGRITEPGGKSATLGELAGMAATLPVPQNVEPKPASDYRLVGTRKTHRLDSPAKTDGSAIYTIDIERPGQWIAVVAHPPRFGATVAAVDSSAAEAMEGVHAVVQIPRGVAVLADSYYTATQARAKLAIEWDDSAGETRSSNAMEADFQAALGAMGKVARTTGNAAASLEGADKTVSAEFTFPYLAHASMEPMDCVVELSDGRCEIWTGSQLQTVDQQVAAAIAGVPPENVVIHTHYAGGSFGRRAVPDSDYVAEAVSIAKAINGKAPVKLLWSREDDMTGGRYRPMSVHRLEGALDDKGNIVAWHHRMAMQSVLAGTPFAAMIQDGIDSSSVEGARGLPYAIENVQVELHDMESAVPVLWWRSVGHTHNGFATEVFFDRLAHAANKDPLELRQALLKDHPRHLAVLNLAAEKGGWGKPMNKGQGRGIAVHESFGSLVAEVVDVTIDQGGALSVDKVTCAVDCGIAVNPDVIAAQMEGGIGYALSAVLREAITLTNGEVDQKNFDKYQVLRMADMPEVEVHIVPSENPPSGVGEPGVPPLAPALANAIFAASGKEVNRLPMGTKFA